MKSITELSEHEAKEIIEFVYPKKSFIYDSISTEPVIDKVSGREQITFGCESIIGIRYWNDYPDRCILHFHNSQVVYWLYKNGYNVLDS